MTNITFVDENDQVIGSGSKGEALEKGYTHRVVRIYLFNSKGELLICKRADHLKSSPGKWGESAAGHVDEGEDYLTAATRELVEEVGISGVELKECGKFFTEKTLASGNVEKRFNFVFTATYDGDVKANADEVSEFHWINPVKLDEWMIKTPDEFTAGSIKAFELLKKVK